jgi:integrase
VSTLCNAWRAKNAQATRYLRTRALIRVLNHITALTGRRDLLAAVIRVKRPRPRTTIATPEEIEKLLDAAPPWMKTIILLAAHAGLRRSDCMRLSPAHYDPQKRILCIDQKKTKRQVSVPVTDRLAKNLEAIETADRITPYYEQSRGKALRWSALDDHWNALKKKAGVNKHLWIHDLRRTAAVSLYQLTKDLTAVQHLLGHQSLNSTCDYLEHKDPAKLKPYLDQLWRPRTKDEVIQ